MLIVLVGARGAGKTTLLDTVRKHHVEVLQPSTTRDRREGEGNEYDFVKQWAASRYAWSIPVGEDTYGMRRSELAKAESKTCVTVFEPLNLHVFEALRRSLGFETITVGLSTIHDLSEQHRRVGNNPERSMTEAELARVTAIVSESDVVLTGDAETVANAMLSLIKLVAKPGGVVTKDHLVPLIRAGAFLTGAELANIRSASYDLRIGREILFQGKVVELTEANPRFEIPPYSYAVVGALENASLPPCVVGRFDLKVSFFFEGIILSNGPQVDPGYKGALFCMLYNGSGQSKLLTLGRHFATIDFTTTTSVTEGYKQKYQLKQRMGQFLTDSAVTGRGGAIVDLVEERVSIVDGKVKTIQRSFWAIAAAFIGMAVLAPALTIPVAWIEIDKLRAERLALDEAQKKTAELLKAAASDRAEAKRLLQQSIIATRPPLQKGRLLPAPDR
jgi:deoxycytidine triphosphate deaminase/adenylate kinase family enzyme